MNRDEIMAILELKQDETKVFEFSNHKEDRAFVEVYTHFPDFEYFIRAYTTKSELLKDIVTRGLGETIKALVEIEQELKDFGFYSDPTDIEWTEGNFDIWKDDDDE